LSDIIAIYIYIHQHLQFNQDKKKSFFPNFRKYTLFANLLQSWYNGFLFLSFIECLKEIEFEMPVLASSDCGKTTGLSLQRNNTIPNAKLSRTPNLILERRIDESTRSSEEIINKVRNTYILKIAMRFPSVMNDGLEIHFDLSTEKRWIHC